MDQLVRTIKLGDVTFGVPGDIALLNKPFGFYDFLGVSRKASQDELKKAYRQRAIELHPDKGGRQEDFVALERVINILLDDGGELGPEHSQRNQYDTVSSLDEFFDGYVQKKGDRTRKLSEIMLMHIEAQRKFAEVDLECTKVSSEYVALKQKLQHARSKDSAERIAEQMMEVVGNIKGIPKEARREIKDVAKKALEQHHAELRKFVESLEKNMNLYRAKVLDVFYVEKGGKVGFGKERLVFGLGGFEDSTHILKLVLAGECYICGFPQVHFKAEEANVKIIDEHLTGIVHIIKGNVDVKYDATSYGNVIRARAPKVSLASSPINNAFVQRGDLFVPERFATQNWWRRKPSLDIAVHDGVITLQLKSQQFESLGCGNGTGYYTDLESLLKLKNKDTYINNYTTYTNERFYT